MIKKILIILGIVLMTNISYALPTIAELQKEDFKIQQEIITFQQAIQERVQRRWEIQGGIKMLQEIEREKQKEPKE